MDESKPAIPPSEFRLLSASERASAGIDPAPVELAKSTVAIYYRNEEEVGKGFLVALRAMGVAVVEQAPEPAKPPGRGAKP